MRVRAIEVVLCIFVTVLGIYASQRLDSVVLFEVGRRSGIVLSTFVLVATIGAAFKYFRLPWSDDSREKRLFLRMVAGVAALPALFVGFVALTTEAPESTELRLTDVMMVMIAHLATVGFISAPFLVVLTLGLELKTTPDFSAIRFIKKSTMATLSGLREWLPLVWCITIYSLLDDAVGPPEHTADAMLARADLWLFGRDPHEALQPLIWVPLSEWLAFCYTFFGALFPLVIGAMAWRHGTPAIREVTFTLGLALLGSYVSYVTIPAGGPLLSKTYAVNLDMYLIRSVKEALMDRTRITWDCFPSMHTGDTVILMTLAYKYVRRLFWVLLPICGCIPFACIYLRYHYVVDVIAGFAFAGFFLTLNHFVGPNSAWVKRRETRTSQPLAAPAQ